MRIPVDGRVVVTRTRDGGDSSDLVTSCLPPVACLRWTA